MITGFTLDLSPFLDDVERAGLDALEDAVTRAGEVVAFAARADHPYTDRTGDLTGSIEGLPAVRTANGAQGGVVAGMDYASYVEGRGYAFLEPALMSQQGRIDHELADALSRAAARLQ